MSHPNDNDNPERVGIGTLVVGTFLACVAAFVLLGLCVDGATCADRCPPGRVGVMVRTLSRVPKCVCVEEPKP